MILEEKCQDCNREGVDLYSSNKHYGEPLVLRCVVCFKANAEKHASCLQCFGRNGSTATWWHKKVAA